MVVVGLHYNLLNIFTKNYLLSLCLSNTKAIKSFSILFENLNPILYLFFSETNITKLDGSTVLLACQANGMPLPKIRWTKNGKNVTSNDKIEQKPLGDLQINSLGLEDEGIYVCEGIVMRRKN